MYCRNSLKSIVQGFLPGIALKIFLILLPTFLVMMSKIEGHTSLSGLDRRTASKYYLFLFVNVFLGSVITGTAFQQLNNFIHQSANKYAQSVIASLLWMWVRGCVSLTPDPHWLSWLMFTS